MVEALIVDGGWGGRGVLGVADADRHVGVVVRVAVLVLVVG